MACEVIHHFSVSRFGSHANHFGSTEWRSPIPPGHDQILHALAVAIAMAALGVKETDKSHRIAVIRAAKKIPGLDYWVSENLGNQLVFYDPLNVLSYAMARLKADCLVNYRNADPRCPPENETEADLRATLGNDERYRKLISEGGSWWLHTEVSRAKARGDQRRAAKLQAQADEIAASVLKRIGTLKLPG